MAYNIQLAIACTVVCALCIVLHLQRLVQYEWGYTYVHSY